jgi:hypothetical protein
MKHFSNTLHESFIRSIDRFFAIEIHVVSGAILHMRAARLDTNITQPYIGFL